MSRNVVVLISSTICLLYVASAMPQDVGKVVEEASGGSGSAESNQTSESLPFLQFKDGGIRVNFAGFHAEAGLGGILTGSRTGGGLRASAGTPWGANAAAGLGGMLGGDNANAGGGLYARAGLGEGLPEARAGLGGVLDGSGRSARPASGGLFAGATTGGSSSASRGIFGSTGGFGGGFDVPPPSYATATGAASADASAGAQAGGSASADADAAAQTKKHSTNIQIVSRSQKNSPRLNEAVKAENVENNTQVDNGRKPEPEKIPPKQPQSYSGLSASAGLFGAITADGPVVKKVKYTNAGLIPSDTAQPQFAIADNHPGTVFDNNVYTIEKPVRSRWHVRKRLRAGIPRKQIVYTSDINAAALPPNPPIVARPLSDSEIAGSATVYKTVHTGTLFDDIFNIPISTLTAVNQLLRNNAG